MTAYELMDRMTMNELLEWVDLDNSRHTPEETRHAEILTKIDGAMWTKGNRRPDVKRYLRPIRKPPKARPKSVAEYRNRLLLSLGIVKPEMFGLPRKE